MGVGSTVYKKVGVTGPLTDAELRATPVPVTNTSLPLPSGASTEAKQDTIITHVDGIEGLLATIDADTGALLALDFATETTLAAMNAKITACDTTGKATEAKQDTANLILTDIETNTTKVTGNGPSATAQRVVIASGGTGTQIVDGSAVTQPVSIASAVPVTDNGGSLTVDGPLTDSELRATPVPVSGTIATGGLTDAELRATPVPVSGTVTVNQPVSIDDNGGSITVDGTVGISGTVPVSAVSLPLPSGAATSANQSTVIGHVDGIETLLGTIDSDTSTLAGVDFATQTTSAAILTELQGKADLGETQPVSAASLPLPSGASTSALQTTGNGILTTMNTSLDNIEASVAKPTILSKCGTISSSGNNTIVAALTNKIKVLAFSLTSNSNTATTAIFQSGSGGTALWQVLLQNPGDGSGGANLAVAPPGQLFETAAATLLNINLSAATTVHYSVTYFEEI